VKTPAKTGASEDVQAPPSPSCVADLDLDPDLEDWNTQWERWMDGEGPAPKALHLVGQDKE